eukprot:1203564-Rhodomonas_salina.1
MSLERRNSRASHAQASSFWSRLRPPRAVRRSGAAHALSRRLASRTRCRQRQRISHPPTCAGTASASRTPQTLASRAAPYASVVSACGRRRISGRWSTQCGHARAICMVPAGVSDARVRACAVMRPWQSGAAACSVRSRVTHRSLAFVCTLSNALSDPPRCCRVSWRSRVCMQNDSGQSLHKWSNRGVKRPGARVRPAKLGRADGGEGDAVLDRRHRRVLGAPTRSVYTFGTRESERKHTRESTNAEPQCQHVQVMGKARACACG